MESSILKKAGKNLQERKKRSKWKGAAAILAVVLVAGTVFMLARPASTLEKESYCGMEEHEHADECYEKVLICGYDNETAASGGTAADGAQAETPVQNEEAPAQGEAPAQNETLAEGKTPEAEAPKGAEASQAAGHTHTEACYTEKKTLTCAQEENGGHTHTDDCYAVTEKKELTCGKEETEEHKHEDGCYTVTENRELTCGKEEGAGAHKHEDGCYETSKELTCGKEEAPAGNGQETQQPPAEQNPAEQPPAEQNPTEQPPADSGTSEGHVHTDECYELKETCGKAEHTHTEECFDATYTCGRKEHAHTEACYDENGNLTCGQEEHTHIQRCRMPVFCGIEGHEHEYSCYIGTEVTEEDKERILKVDAMIDALPTYAEIEAQMHAYDEAGDIGAQEAYYAETAFQANLAYAYFEDLNSTKDLDLQKYVVNSEKLAELSAFWESAMMTVSDEKKVQVNAINTMGPVNTTALIYAETGTVADVVGNDAFVQWTAWVIEKENESDLIVRDVIPAGEDTVEQKLTLELTPERFVLFSHGTATANDMAEVAAEDYVSLDFEYAEQPNEARAAAYGTVAFGERELMARGTNSISTLQSASTKDIVDIKMFNYGSNINSRCEVDGKGKYTNKYPGFQQDYGTLGAAQLTKGTGYNFGDNIVKDYAADGRSIVTASETPINSINALRPAYGPTKTNATIGGNKGYSSSALWGEFSPMKKILGANGYPELSNGTNLDYLFSEGSYATLAGSGLDGLFIEDSVTGGYEFDSRKFHAQLSGDRFVLYDALLTPNYAMYPFGNFMPFNSITNGATITSDITRQYFVDMRDSARTKAEANADGLGTAYGEMNASLNNFINAMDSSQNGGVGNKDWDGKTVINKYFEATKADNGGVNKTDSWINKAMDAGTKLYNIDYDIPKDFFFGMSMEMNYLQPKNGKIYKGKDKKELDVKFEFAGDDDVWVYVDGTLLLDLSGIHRHVAGTIDFTRGTVTYYGFHSYAAEPLGAITGKSTGAVEKTYTFEEIITAAYKDGGARAKELLKEENGKLTTFKDYTTHDFKFYYMERGAGSSVCRINFNFPVVPKNSIAVGKEVITDGNQEALGNPDFEFQVLDKSVHGKEASIPKDLYVKPGKVYDIYDLNGKDTGKDGTVDDNGIIRLKSGEMAIIKDIDADSGEYFVRELLDVRAFEQYRANITIGGTTETVDLQGVTVGGEQFMGADSPILNIDAGDVTTFKFENKVDFDKTGSLEILKNVVDSKVGVDKTFDFAVTLDGEPVPAGTPYTLSRADGSAEQKTVATAGVISLKSGEKAEIVNILAGSKYTVQETSASAEGFDVEYNITTRDTPKEQEAQKKARTMEQLGQTMPDQKASEKRKSRTFDELLEGDVEEDIWDLDHSKEFGDPETSEDASGEAEGPEEETGGAETPGEETGSGDISGGDNAEDNPAEDSGTGDAALQMENQHIVNADPPPKRVEGMIGHHTIISITVTNTGKTYGNLEITKKVLDSKGVEIPVSEDSPVINEKYSFLVYMENLSSKALEPYTEEFYLRDAEGFFYEYVYDDTTGGNKLAKTTPETKDVSNAKPCGNAAGGIITLPSYRYTIVLGHKPEGTAFYAAELSEGKDANNIDYLDPNKYVVGSKGMPKKELGGDFKSDNSVKNSDQTISSDGLIIVGTAQVIVTNQLRDWNLIKRSSTTAQENLLLAGAEFVLEKKDINGTPYNAYTGVTNKDGEITWTNVIKNQTVTRYEIEAGEYTMKETKAPTGYALSEVQWKLHFTSDGAVPSVKQLDSAGNEVDLKETDKITGTDGEVTYYFNDEPFYALPSAGGSGIYWYSIGGTLLMIAAALVLYKKNSAGRC